MSPHSHNKAASTHYVKLGTAYGGWYLPQDLLLTADDICYLAGAGEDISFDCALAMKFPCQVHIFDPTPRAITHATQLRTAVDKGTPFPINNSAADIYEITPNAMQQIHFHPWGLASQDAEFKFYVPQNPAHVSHSILNLQKTQEYFTAQCKRVSTICKELGHSTPALIKIDIEGAEYQVIQDLIDTAVLPRILLVEFDEFHCPIDPKSGQRILQAIELLQRHGMRLAHLDAGNATFLA